MNSIMAAETQALASVCVCVCAIASYYTVHTYIKRLLLLLTEGPY